MRVTVIHNPAAGGNGGGIARIRAGVAAQGHALTLFSSQDGDLAEALAAPADLIVVAGGDGTVAKVAAALPAGRDRPPLAILPVGTANNIAAALGIAGAPEALIAQWPLWTRRRVDMAVVTRNGRQSPALEGVGLGVLAEAMRAIHRADVDGVGELPAARETLRGLLGGAAAFDPRLVIDGHPVPGDALLVEVINIGRLGPALSLAPQADPGDGLLDVVIVPGAARAAMAAWLAAPECGPAPVTVRRGVWVDVEADGPILRLGDSFPEPGDAAGPIRVAQAAEPLTVLAPRAGKAAMP